MKDLIAQLFALQGIELGPAPESAENKESIARLRQKIPTQILGHYDRLMVRGKKGIALVRHGVCTECHMRLASGTYAQLLRREDVLICDSCGRYLHTLEESPAESAALPPPPPPPETKPVEKKRRRKKTPDPV